MQTSQRALITDISLTVMDTKQWVTSELDPLQVLSRSERDLNYEILDSF